MTRGAVAPLKGRLLVFVHCKIDFIFYIEYEVNDTFTHARIPRQTQRLRPALGPINLNTDT